MKIAIVVNNICKSAGTERAVVNLANILTSKDYGGNRLRVTIISLYSDDVKLFYELNSSVKVYSLGLEDIKSKFISPIHYYKVIRTLRLRFREIKPNIIIGTTHAINFLLPFVASGLRCKTIGCEHLAYNAGSKLVNWVKSVLYSRLSSVVVLTHKDALSYVRFCNVNVIPNSLSFWPNQNANLDSKQLLSVGRFSLQKGFDRLVQAASLFLPINPSWTLKIIGDGEEKNKVIDLVKAYNLQKQIVILPSTRNIIQEYLESSIYLMTSRYEGLPMVLLEAKACGLPVVSFDCPEGPSEIIKDQEDGLLVENGNIAEFAFQVSRLINNRDLQEKFALNSKANSQEYSQHAIFIKWRCLFDKIM